MVIGIIVVLAALVVAGGAVTLYLLRQQDTLGAEPNGPRTPTPGVDASVTAESPATAEPSKNVRFVEVGQCVRNDGTQERPELVVAACAPKTYEVLARIDGATTGKADAQRKCAPVAGYTDWFYHDTALDELDFVLCLKANK
ncbi:MAG TPA: hypothetical protein VF174_08725 [Micromonosporaceae bacterium]